MTIQAPIHAQNTGRLVEEITKFIDTEGFHAARMAMQNRHFIELDGDVMTIRRNSWGERTIMIRRGPDGSASCSQPDFELLQRGRSDVYTITWNNLLSVSQKELYEAVEVFLYPILFRELDSKTSEKISRAVDRVGRVVRATIGFGYLPQPSRLGNGMLYKFLGKEKVRQTLSLAGPHATIEHFNLVLHHDDTLERVRQTDPNALTWWLYQIASTREYVELDSAGIISQARDEFPNPNHWDIFCNLSPKLIREFPSDRHINSVIVARELSGCIPSYTISRYLGRNYILLVGEDAQPMIKLLCQASRLSARRRGCTQTELVGQPWDMKNRLGHKLRDRTALARFWETLDQDQTTWAQFVQTVKDLEAPNL